MDKYRLKTQDIDLGKNGSHWKHGWIPLNAAAVALKHKSKHSVTSHEGYKGNFSEHSVRDQRGLTGHTDMIRSTLKSRSETRMGRHTVFRGQSPEHFGVYDHETNGTHVFPRDESGMRAAALHIRGNKPTPAAPRKEGESRFGAKHEQPTHAQKAAAAKDAIGKEVGRSGKA